MEERIGIGGSFQDDPKWKITLWMDSLRQKTREMMAKKGTAVIPCLTAEIFRLADFRRVYYMHDFLFGIMTGTRQTRDLKRELRQHFQSLLTEAIGSKDVEYFFVDLFLILYYLKFLRSDSEIIQIDTYEEAETFLGNMEAFIMAEKIIPLNFEFRNSTFAPVLLNRSRLFDIFKEFLELVLPGEEAITTIVFKNLKGAQQLPKSQQVITYYRQTLVGNEFFKSVVTGSSYYFLAGYVVVILSDLLSKYTATNGWGATGMGLICLLLYASEIYLRHIAHPAYVHQGIWVTVVGIIQVLIVTSLVSNLLLFTETSYTSTDWLEGVARETINTLPSLVSETLALKQALGYIAGGDTLKWVLSFSISVVFQTVRYVFGVIVSRARALGSMELPEIARNTQDVLYGLALTGLTILTISHLHNVKTRTIAPAGLEWSIEPGNSPYGIVQFTKSDDFWVPTSNIFLNEIKGIIERAGGVFDIDIGSSLVKWHIGIPPNSTSTLDAIILSMQKEGKSSSFNAIAQICLQLKPQSGIPTSILFGVPKRDSLTLLVGILYGILYYSFLVIWRTKTSMPENVRLLPKVEPFESFDKVLKHIDLKEEHFNKPNELLAVTCSALTGEKYTEFDFVGPDVLQNEVIEQFRRVFWMFQSKKEFSGYLKGDELRLKVKAICDDTTLSGQAYLSNALIRVYPQLRPRALELSVQPFIRQILRIPYYQEVPIPGLNLRELVKSVILNVVNLMASAQVDDKTILNYASDLWYQTLGIRALFWVAKNLFALGTTWMLFSWKTNPNKSKIVKWSEAVANVKSLVFYRYYIFDIWKLLTYETVGFLVRFAYYYPGYANHPVTIEIFGRLNDKFDLSKALEKEKSTKEILNFHYGKSKMSIIRQYRPLRYIFNDQVLLHLIYTAWFKESFYSVEVDIKRIGRIFSRDGTNFEYQNTTFARSFRVYLETGKPSGPPIRLSEFAFASSG